MKFTPHQYQLKAIEFIVKRPCAGLLLDPGLGKTSITLAAYKVLRKHVGPMLVVAPLRPASSVWPSEMRKWDDFNGLKYVVLHGPDKDQLAKQDVDVYIINYEGLNWLTQRAKHIIKKCGLLVIDESSYIKNPQSQRFKILRKSIISQIGRRMILTGTPTPNSLLDLWSQAYVLDGGEMLGKFFSHYRAQYFVPTGFEGRAWVIADKCEDKIHKAVAPYMLRMAGEDYLELPTLHIVDRYVDLDKKSRELYDEMEDKFVVELHSGRIKASNAAVATGKMRQIASGAMYDEQHNAIHIHDEKLDQIVELVEELEGQSLMILVQFEHEVQRLRAALKSHGHIPYLGGGLSPKESIRIEQEWNDHTHRIVLGHPRSMGHGLNLQAGGYHLSYMSLPWSYEEYIQSMRRLHRQGQKRPVFVHRILARETIDDAVIRSLARKAKGQNAFFDAVQSYYATRVARALKNKRAPKRPLN